MHQETISRRAFLAAAAAAGASLLGLGERLLAAPSSQPLAAPYPDKFHRDGGLVVLPGRGELYVASDFHSRHADFRKWLSKTDLVAKLKDRDDVFGLILGDAVDKKADDPLAEDNGDSRIIDEIRAIQDNSDQTGKRLIFIRGNHEHEVWRIYDALKRRYGLNAANRRRFVEALYATEQGSFFRQFNFLERISEEQFEYLGRLPVAVLARNGVVAVHAGPSKLAKSPRQLAQMDEQVVEELVWTRPGQTQGLGVYVADDVTAFLKMMDGAGLLLTGHTPLSSLPEDWIQNGIGVFADHQVILATSYGSEPGEKSYLVLDLAKRYASARDLKAGKEIQRLGAEVGMAAPVHLAQRRVA
jgi:predicted phosphodiesterase